MSDNLRPCPFCEGEALRDKILRDGCKYGEPDDWAYFNRCRSCAAEGPWAKTPGNADRMWNARPTHDAPVEALKWVRCQIAKVPIHQTTSLEEEIFRHVNAALRGAGVSDEG